MSEVVAAREAMQRQVAHQRGLLVHLHEAQEAERQRIAGEIHDDTVQVMAAVHLRLQSLRRSLEPLLPADQVADLDALDQAVREATGRLRRTAGRARPATHHRRRRRRRAAARRSGRPWPASA